jgi:hypothetical protein
LQSIALAAGIAAALLFPIVALVAHQTHLHRRNRRAGRRRTQKIRL